MPKIGITSTAGDPGAAYVRAVERAGGEAVLLSNALSELEERLATLDGVVVSGGVDVDPTRYGGRSEHSRCERDEYSAERDGFEIALVRATRVRDVPTLCICRGLQIANVAFGGTLVEDLRDELGVRYTIEHRQTYDSGLERYDYAEGHTVTVLPASAFAGWYARPHLRPIRCTIKRCATSAKGWSRWAVRTTASSKCST